MKTFLVGSIHDNKTVVITRVRDYKLYNRTYTVTPASLKRIKTIANSMNVHVSARENTLYFAQYAI